MRGKTAQPWFAMSSVQSSPTVSPVNPASDMLDESDVLLSRIGSELETYSNTSRQVDGAIEIAEHEIEVSESEKIGWLAVITMKNECK